MEHTRGLRVGVGWVVQGCAVGLVEPELELWSCCSVLLMCVVCIDEFHVDLRGVAVDEPRVPLVSDFGHLEETAAGANVLLANLGCAVDDGGA